jgi:hypothetical protein
LATSRRGGLTRPVLGAKHAPLGRSTETRGALDNRIAFGHANESRHDQCPDFEVRPTSRRTLHANFGIERHWQLYGPGAVLDLKFLRQGGRENGRNFKSTAPVVAILS